MTETQRRIKAYQKLLPQLRERVFAVALLLAMSVSMLSSASFAWLTLSRNPEVTAVNTTVASNGNLEIALASGESYTIVPPGDSQVGDSSATEGQSVTAANITWGNLVNLADPSYGLDQMVLRPAQLNKSNLLDSPLYGATYGQDGRTDRLASEFAYATWEPKNEAIGRMEDSFVLSDRLGVRAVTSTASGESSEYQIQFGARKNAAEDANRAAGTYFSEKITGNKDLMGSLATIMGIYLTDNLNDSNSNLDQIDVSNMEVIFSEFIKVYEQQIDAMVKLANFQLFSLNEGKTENYTEFTREKLLQSNENSLPGGVKLRGLNQMKTDYQTLMTYYSGTPTNSSGVALDNMVTIAEKAKKNQTITYDNLEHIVNALVNISECQIVAGGTTYKVGNVGAGSAVNILRSEGEKQAIITNGILKNFQQLNGSEVKIDNMKVTVTYMITLSIEADISTNAKAPYYFAEGLQYASDVNTGGEPVLYSEDTYGLAIDLWLRTNAPNSYLTLEGNVLTRKEEVTPTVDVTEEEYTAEINGETIRVYPIVAEDGTATWYDLNTGDPVDIGNQTPQYKSETKPYDLYALTVTQTDGAGESYSYTVDLYCKEDADGTVTWYNASTHQKMELSQGQEPKKKVEVLETVIGYEGVNRIWDDGDSDLISSDATTQGSGSCYVYYADTPEDQARSLALLEAFKVAFVDDQGKLLATASMDTERHYATTGRVIVPLKLDESESIRLEDETTSKVTYAITELETNEPMRITALVYLDGTKLYNENVLAAADIQGRLNIQFGTSEQMKPIEDLELAGQVRTVSASLDKTEFDTDDNDTTVNVTVEVDGDSPSSVSAFFLREINATQGSREETMTFTKQSEGKWTSSYTFTAPGTYVLRSVQLDGIEYDLPESSICRATVKGFAVKSLKCEEGEHLSVMTAGTSQKVNLTLEFASDDVEKMPKTVQGLYLRADGSTVKVDFTNTGTNWKGSATFLASGKYTMQYLILDGNYSELPSSLWLTADLTMGMKVEVKTSSNTDIKYDPDDEYLPTSLNMRVKILDGEGTELKSLTGARLYYSKAGTTEKLVTPVDWDPQEECYTGSFPVRVGNYSFSHVEVGKNTLRVANADAPIFRISPNDPPGFTGDVTPKAQVVIGADKTATMQVTIAHSEAASVRAVLVKKDLTETVDGITVQKTFTVEGDLDTTGIWNFPVPKITSDGTADAENGTQDGYWTIQELKVYNAYDPTGNAYTEANPLVFNAQSKEVRDKGGFVESKVISNAYVSLAVPDKWNAHLGAESYTENGQTKYRANSPFLTSHTVTGLKVYVTDFEALSLDNDELKIDVDVQMDYNYVNQSSGTYGGYTSQQIDNSTESKTGLVYTETKDANGATYFVLNETVTADQAGTYNADVSYTVKVDGNTVGTYHVDADEAKDFNFNVYSKGPTVTVTGTDPKPGTAKRVYSVSEPKDAGQAVQGDFFKYSDYSASVYIHTPVRGSGTFDQEAAHAYAPSVTLKLSGIPTNDLTSATMYFDRKNENSADSNFSFDTTSMTATATVGKAVDGKQSTIGVDTWPKCYPAGRMTQDKVTLKYGSETYSATLTHEVVIEQPQSPTVLVFAGIPDTYTGTKPAQVIGNGTTVTTTLPKEIRWTAYTEEAAAGATWSAYSAYATNDAFAVHTYSDRTEGRFIKTTYRDYQYYDWTTFRSSCTDTIYYYKQDMVIRQWKINGKTYNAGEPFEMTADGIITATAVAEPISDKVSNGDPQVTTTYKYQYGYVKRGSLVTATMVDGAPIVNWRPYTPIGINGVAPDLAVPSTANASTTPVKIGDNMTLDDEDYAKFRN